MKAPAVLAAVTLVLAAAGGAEAQYRRCNHIEWGAAHAYLNTHMELAWSNQGNGPPDTASWDLLSTNAFELAWRGWWHLDLTNPAVFLHDDETDYAVNLSGPDFVSVFQKNTAAPFGQTAPYFSTIFSSVITEVDVRLQGATATSNPPGLFAIAPQATCAHDDTTQAGVLFHEFGHAYGYAHWFDWLSMMNTGQVDVLSCETPVAAGSTASMAITPDALSSQCHDIQYGVAPGVDFSGTPVRQLCALTSNNCAFVLTALAELPVGSSFASVVAEFTTFSNRDSFGADVPYRILLSRNATVSADDREIYRNALAGWSAGATQWRRRVVLFNPQVALPLANTTYYVLIQLDPDNVIAETRETNNVIDTRIRVRRQ